MAHCLQNPSSPTQSNLSGSERRKIYLSQQQKQQIIQSGYKANSINAQNPQQLDHLSSFQQTHDEKSSVHGQVLDPINSLVNGWPDFNMIGSTSFDANNLVSETSLKEINKRKCESSSETSLKEINKRKCESSSETKEKNKSRKEDNKITNEEKNKSRKEERLSKGKNKKEFSSENSKGNAKVSDSSSITPKLDYIHVRARRGQATDSHSLAERVRRERISERMRHLQELVPGCNKVTGKAGMLDEIINYVQSLQRQVEFLSMKLAAVNPVEEIDIEDLLNRQMNQTNGQLDPTFHQFNPLQQIASCYGLGLEMAMEQPNGLNAVFNGSMPDQLVEPYINVNGSSNWDVGSQNLYGLDPNQARSLNFHFQ